MLNLNPTIIPTVEIYKDGVGRIVVNHTDAPAYLAQGYSIVEPETVNEENPDDLVDGEAPAAYDYASHKTAELKLFAEAAEIELLPGTTRKELIALLERSDYRPS